jgi:PKD repeat protein
MKKMFETIYQKQKALKLFIVGSMILLSSFGLKAQCQANFSDTAMGNGSVLFFSTSVISYPYTSCAWNFGDGTTGFGSNIIHTYNNNNTYTVVMYLTNFDSLSGQTCKDSIVKSVVVNNAVSNPCNTASIISYNNGANGLVYFTASSPLMNPLPINYTWHFGDGSFGSGDSISHTYTNNGTYNVFAIAHINGTTCYDTIFQSISVVNASPCSLNPIVSYVSNPGGNVSFTCSSLLTVGFNTVWDFGDGNVSIVGNTVQHTYAVNGTYALTAYVQILGTTCIDTLSYAITITNATSNNCNLLANFSWTNFSAGLFNFTSNSLGTQPNTSYFWDFGDGNFMAGPSVSHNYTSNGTFLVMLVTTTIDTVLNLNCSDSIIYTINVSNAIPNACNLSAYFWAPLSAAGGVSFYDGSSGLGTNSTYSWNFGDGTSGTGASIGHTYASNGNYQVLYIVTTIDSLSGATCSDSSLQVVSISNVGVQSCFASFVASKNPSGSYTFSSSSSGASPNTTYAWSFGDGTFGTGASPTHIYTASGLYNVTLSIINSDPFTGSNCYDTITQSVTVNTSATQCNLNTNFNIWGVGIDGNVGFWNLSTNVTPYTTYFWDFGDGQTSTSNSMSLFGIYYLVNGTYQVTLVATTVDPSTGIACIDTMIKTVTVTTVPPTPNCVANFTYTIDTAGTYNFTSTSSGLAPSTSYYWNFGDGTPTSWAQYHNYTYNGTYNVTLIITCNNSSSGALLCTDTAVQTIVVTNAAPAPCIASVTFSMAPDSTTALTWMAMPVYAPTTVSAVWYWGDGSSTSGFNPSHTYLAPGIYNICVIATDACGALDTACMTSNIMKSSNGSGLIYTINVISNFTPLGPLSIKNVTKDNFILNIYPNPNNGEFTISTKSETQFTLMNELGQIIKTDATNAANNFSTKVSGLNTGLYFILANSKNTTYRKKIVVTK